MLFKFKLNISKRNIVKNNIITFHHKKLLERKKENGEISQEAFSFELEQLKEKYAKLFLSPSPKQAKYNCTKID